MGRVERKFDEFIALGEAIDPKDWLIAYYYVEGAKGFSPIRVAAAIAAEESIGTWTRVTTETERAKRFAGKVIEVEGNYVQVAFPCELFEPGNIPQLLSVVAGNLFGLKAVKNCRLLDVRLPRKYVRGFKGPRFGMRGVRRIVGTAKSGRPHVGTIIKPKVGLTARATAEVAYEAGMGGIDHIKDDETLTNQRAICPIEERLTRVMEKLDQVKAETGRTVLYTVNVTHDPSRMIERAERMVELGANAIMMDVITCGFSALRELREAVKVPIHVHRCMHAAFTRNPRHGISMNVIAKLVRLVGGDQLHVGTVIGKMHGERDEVLASQEVCKAAIARGFAQRTFEQNWWGLKPVFPISSGGLHPGLVPELMAIMGTDVGMQFGGGIHGHPDGTRAGARAVRQAVDAVMAGIPLEVYAREHVELAKALNKWGRFRPKA
jgi:ribulose-bisphosphate carboxylase large chain